MPLDSQPGGELGWSRRYGSLEQARHGHARRLLACRPIRVRLGLRGRALDQGDRPQPRRAAGQPHRLQRRPRPGRRDRPVHGGRRPGRRTGTRGRVGRRELPGPDRSLRPAIGGIERRRARGLAPLRPRRRLGRPGGVTGRSRSGFEAAIAGRRAAGRGTVQLGEPAGGARDVPDRGGLDRQAAPSTTAARMELASVLQTVGERVRRGRLGAARPVLGPVRPGRITP